MTMEYEMGWLIYDLSQLKGKEMKRQKREKNDQAA